VAWTLAESRARRRRRLTGDVRYARYTRAGRAAKTALGAARAARDRGDVAGGHDAVAAALRDYLAAKLDLPPGTIAETAPERLRRAGVDGALADDVAAFFAGCEATRFAPSAAGAADLERALERAEAIVRTLERTRRIAPARAAMLAVLALALAGRVLASGAEGPGAVFIRANGLYGTEQYAQAAAAYEEILAGGVESGAVHFNLGNAYLKAGDVGRAVLGYERARRLVPGDPDVAANLEFARELARDVVEPSVVQRLLFPLADRVSTNGLALAALVAWWVLWVSLAVGVLLPAGAGSARSVAVVAGLGCALVATSGIYRWWTIERPTFAVVVARDDVSVRSEPTPSATALFVARPGTVVVVDRTREASSLVTSRDGRRGWLESSALATL
jgi:tetratricopeptide (TPR) repeat protein